MPGTTIGIGIGQGPRKSTVHVTALAGRSSAVDGGAGEWVPELNARVVYRDQRCSLGGDQVGEIQPKHRRGAGKHRDLAAVDGGGEDEDIARALRKRPGAVDVDVGDAGSGSEWRTGREVRQPLSFLAKLKERERIPACLLVEAVREVLTERLVPLVPEQFNC